MVIGFESWIFLVAGIITGVITGMVGASAIVAFVPLILLFLDYDVFSLIGISLAVDVFVSLTALLMYKKFHHIDFKMGIYLSIFAVAGAILGSYVSIFFPNESLLAITGLVSALTGVGIFLRKTDSGKLSKFSKKLSLKKPLSFIPVFLSLIIGFVAGSLGAAGGVSLLLLFVFLFRFETHKAIGTSIFVMFFIALAGSITHFYYIKFSWEILIYAIIGGIVGAVFSSRIANYLKEKTLNKIVGIILFVLGISIFLQRVI
jgi:uncharacterized protein